MNKLFRGAVYPGFIILAVILLLVGVFIFKGMASSVVPSADGKISVEKPKAEQVIHKVFYFPLKDDEGKEVTKLKYEIQNVELRDEIIVKGQKANAVEGKTFLVINIKITNDYDKPIELRARDYIRLEVDRSTEKLAPEIHNDPVEVQALSTKYTRLGFTIDDNQKNMKLLVGEIGEKTETIQLKLK